MSGAKLKRFYNTSGNSYKNLNLKDKLKNMSEKEQYSLLGSDGMLVKRPLLIDGADVLIGFCEGLWRAYFKK